MSERRFGKKFRKDVRERRFGKRFRTDVSEQKMVWKDVRNGGFSGKTFREDRSVRLFTERCFGEDGSEPKALARYQNRGKEGADRCCGGATGMRPHKRVGLPLLHLDALNARSSTITSAVYCQNIWLIQNSASLVPKTTLTTPEKKSMNSTLSSTHAQGSSPHKRSLHSRDACC